MINPEGYIKQAFFSLLNEAIVYDGVTVPVYEGNTGEPVAGTAATYKIEISNSSFFERNTKTSFTGDWKQDIEVITEMPSGVSKHANAIVSLITQLVTPTPNSTGLSINPLFTLTSCKVRSITPLTEQGQSGDIVRRIITFSFIINQK